MKIEFEHIKDNEDGSATVVINSDKEGYDHVFKYGIVAMLKDGIKKAKKKYSDEEYSKKDYYKDELKSLGELLAIYDEQLKAANELIVRLQRDPLSEERLVALYRRSMDWRQFARDVEKEHGVGEVAHTIEEIIEQPITEEEVMSQPYQFDDVGYDE